MHYTLGKQLVVLHLRAAFAERLCDCLVGVGKVSTRCCMVEHTQVYLPVLLRLIDV